MLNSSFIEETNEVVLKGVESLSSSFLFLFPLIFKNDEVDDN